MDRVFGYRPEKAPAQKRQNGNQGKNRPMPGDPRGKWTGGKEERARPKQSAWELSLLSSPRNSGLTVFLSALIYSLHPWIQPASKIHRSPYLHGSEEQNHIEYQCCTARGDIKPYPYPPSPHTHTYILPPRQNPEWFLFVKSLSCVILITIT